MIDDDLEKIVGEGPAFLASFSPVRIGVSRQIQGLLKCALVVLHYLCKARYPTRIHKTVIIFETSSLNMQIIIHTKGLFTFVVPYHHFSNVLLHKFGSEHFCGKSIDLSLLGQLTVSTGRWRFRTPSFLRCFALCQFQDCEGQLTILCSSVQDFQPK